MLKVTGSDEKFSVDYSHSTLKNSPRNQGIITRLLKGENHQEQQLITFQSKDAYQAILTLRRVAERLGVMDDIEGDTGMEEILQKAEAERENFSTFSTKAREIRDNVYDLDDYLRFEQSTEKLKRPLKTFQLLAAYHLTFAQNAGNFSVPGAGKTMTVLSAFNYLHNLEEANGKYVDTLVVICPLAAFKAWKDEYVVGYGREPRVLEIHGGSPLGKSALKAELLASESDYDIIVVGYASLNSYEEELGNFLSKHRVMLVLDEAHRIKKVDTGLWAEAVLRLAPAARSRVVLTGTPAPNGYIDLRNLFKFMWPDKDIIGYSNSQLRQMNDLTPEDSKVKDLGERLAPFFIRVDKDHLGLPAPTFHDATVVSMGPTQRRIYDAIENLYVPWMAENREKNLGLFKSRLIRLRQAASNPALLTQSLRKYYEDQDLEGEGAEPLQLTDELGVSDDLLKLIRTYPESETPSKFLATKELLQELIANGEKAIVWCEFVKNIEDLGAYLESNGIKVEYLYGKVSKDDRERIIDAFHSPESSFKVVIANPHAVGESISLHKACHNAIYFEMGYNAAAYMQSKDRIHRVGLEADDKTNYYFIVSKDSVDTTVYDSVMAKEKRMLDLIEGQEIPLLTHNADFLEDDSDDLKRLLKDYYIRHGLE